MEIRANFYTGKHRALLTVRNNRPPFSVMKWFEVLLFKECLEILEIMPWVSIKTCPQVLTQLIYLLVLQSDHFQKSQE
jgi:hypothetical protein